MAERVRWVLDRLQTWEGATLRRLFLEIPTRSQRILTFLAILEMARFQLLDVRQGSHLGEVELMARQGVEDADLSEINDSYTAAVAE